MKCPICKSESTQRLQMAYAAGSTTGDVTGRAYTAEGIANFSGTTSSQTDLARIAAPPPEPRFGCVWIFIAYVGVWVAMRFLSAVLQKVTGLNLLPVLVLLALIMFAVLVVMRFLSYSRAKETRKVLMEEWRKRWICLRCGELWTP